MNRSPSGVNRLTPERWLTYPLLAIHKPAVDELIFLKHVFWECG